MGADHVLNELARKMTDFDPEHYRILTEGRASAWNQWRDEHPDVVPALAGAYLREADLAGADLSEADLAGANLSEADLTLTSLRRANLSGAQLSGALLVQTDLSGAFLRGVNLRGANLFTARLGEADLAGGDLGGASFRFADLHSANLREANLRDADLSMANLNRTKLGSADLGDANLRNANLSEADLTGAQLYNANLSEADLSEADLTGARLVGALLVRTDLSGAFLSNCHIYGVSAWDLQGEPAEQRGLVVTPTDQASVEVDDLGTAQFVYLLLNRAKLRDVINAVTEKGVLLLGRFGGGGIKMLRAVADLLRSKGYLPMIFDFERPHDRDYTETVQTLVGLARFVIVDLSGPSVPNELRATVPNFEVPFVPILEEGRKEFANGPRPGEVPLVEGGGRPVLDD